MGRDPHCHSKAPIMEIKNSLEVISAGFPESSLDHEFQCYRPDILGLSEDRCGSMEELRGEFLCLLSYCIIVF